LNPANGQEGRLFAAGRSGGAVTRVSTPFAKVQHFRISTHDKRKDLGGVENSFAFGTIEISNFNFPADL
jgi:hypothetical protein